MSKHTSSPMLAEWKGKLDRTERISQQLQKKAEIAEMKAGGLEKRLIEQGIRANEDRKRGLEDRLRDQARIEDLLMQLALSENMNEQLMKRVNELTIQLEEERNRSNADYKRGLEDRMIDLEKIEGLMKQLAKMWKVSLDQLEQQTRNSEIEKIEGTRIDDGPDETPVADEDHTDELDRAIAVENLEVAKEKKEDEPEKNVAEICEELMNILKENPNKQQWNAAAEILRPLSDQREEYPIIDCAISHLLVKGLAVEDGEIQLFCGKKLAKVVASWAEESSEVPITVVRVLSERYEKVCSSQLSIEMVGMVVQSLFQLLQ
ncbi:hypothetical protein PMAYCL1PPCAC_26476, partial [Pristionchus mayeri]